MNSGFLIQRPPRSRSWPPSPWAPSGGRGTHGGAPARRATQVPCTVAGAEQDPTPLGRRWHSPDRRRALPGLRDLQVAPARTPLPGSRRARGMLRRPLQRLPRAGGRGLRALRRRPGFYPRLWTGHCRSPPSPLRRVLCPLIRCLLLSLARGWQPLRRLQACGAALAQAVGSGACQSPSAAGSCPLTFNPPPRGLGAWPPKRAGRSPRCPVGRGRAWDGPLPAPGTAAPLGRHPDY